MPDAMSVKHCDADRRESVNDPVNEKWQKSCQRCLESDRPYFLPSKSPHLLAALPPSTLGDPSFLR